MRALAFVLVVVVGCDSPQPATSKKTEDPIADIKTPKKTPVKVVARKEPPKANPVQAQDPPKAKTFDESWDEAVRIVEKIESEEPAKTAAALKLLTSSDFLIVNAYLNQEPHVLGGIIIIGRRRTTAAVLLFSRGLGEYALSQSSREARRSSEFKNLMKTFWNQDKSPNDLVVAMRTWLMLADRELIVISVNNNAPTLALPREVRDGILELGGEKWLSR